MKAASPALRLCEYSECRKPLAQREDEWPSDFRKRRFCNRACVHGGNARPVPESKTCPQCGETFTRGTLRRYQYLGKVYCSVPCGARGVAAGHRIVREEEPALAGPHVKYDVDNPPPCFLSLDFFEHEEAIRTRLKFLRPGRFKDRYLQEAMDEVRDRWCLNCPLIEQCGAWGSEEKYTGIAGGDWHTDGVVQ